MEDEYFLMGEALLATASNKWSKDYSALRISHQEIKKQTPKNSKTCSHMCWVWCAARKSRSSQMHHGILKTTRYVELEKLIVCWDFFKIEWSYRSCCSHSIVLPSEDRNNKIVLITRYSVCINTYCYNTPKPFLRNDWETRSNFRYRFLIGRYS